MHTMVSSKAAFYLLKLWKLFTYIILLLLLLLYFCQLCIYFDVRYICVYYEERGLSTDTGIISFVFSYNFCVQKKRNEIENEE